MKTCKLRPNLRKWAATLCLALFAFSFASAATLPHSEAQTLSEKKVAIPADLQGHPTLLVMGFSHKSKDPTTAWGKTIRQQLAGDHHLVLYEAAVLEAVPRMIRGMVIGSIRKDIPEAQREHFLIILHDEKQWKAAADFSNGDDAYLLLADASGNVLWRAHGPVTDAMMSQLKVEVQKAEAEPGTK